ncbi:PAS domain-containing protein [Methylobacterium currus]|uniref:Blue-light-activated histidine kinase n=1 Tax=Methylobacterium currus TaxID=2051553 RepID=A0A2R4WPC6_9HYPH|nr:HWE histidine kinase domain-containing protein [Methylobacterium currus]AWB23358.1 PAS domain-containing protein [Methylobacterium currus]UHC17004.1 PAS domain-containing protein [Methylobacterium currus]
MDQRPDAAPGLPDELFPRFAFEGAPVGLACLSGPDGRILAANPALAALLGTDPGALAGRRLAELDHPQGPGTGHGLAGEVWWRRADGSAVRVRLRTGPERDGYRIVAAEAVADGTAAARAEQTHLALASAGLGEWSWNPADGRVTLSDRAAAILGYPARATPTWRDLQDAVGRDDLDRVRATVQDAVAKAIPYAVEMRFRRAGDGQEAWISARGQATLSPDGMLAGMVGVLQDVTAREEARRALHDREQRLRVATTVAALGIFEWHVLDDQSLWENERMWEIFGRRPQDGTISMREFFRTVVHPEDKVSFRRAVAQALHGDGVLHATTRIRRPEGDGGETWRTIEMAGRFERDGPAGLPRRLIGVVADITDRRLAEERQSLLIRELHHRVKNTLATVQAIVGSTARTASSIDSFYEAFVGRIMSLAHTHSVLTEDVWQTASLHSLLENELRPYADGEMRPGTGGRVELDGPAVDLPSEIAVPIGMAIHELTTNAAKYGALSNRAGRVRIRWSVEPGADRPRLRFHWQESGGPAVAPPTRQGFGSRLLQRVLTTQVQAEVATDYAPGGLALTMLAPLPARNAALNPLAAL